MTDHSKQLLDRLRHFNGLLMRYQHQRHHEQGGFGDPSRGQGRVLTLLKLQPEISQKELAYLLDLRSQSLGELLSKLEKKGYITREPSAEDRRAMLVRLTEAGRQAAEQTSATEVPHWLDSLDEEEQAQMTAYLERLIQALEQALRESGAPDSESWPQFPNPEDFPGGFGPEMGRGRHGRGFGPRHTHSHKHQHKHGGKEEQQPADAADTGAYCRNHDRCGGYQAAPDGEDGSCLKAGHCGRHQA